MEESKKSLAQQSFQAIMPILREFKGTYGDHKQIEHCVTIIEKELAYAAALPKPETPALQSV